MGSAPITKSDEAAELHLGVNLIEDNDLLKKTKNLKRKHVETGQSGAGADGETELKSASLSDSESESGSASSAGSEDFAFID